MRKPNFYKQYDSRWASKVWKGQTLRAHGCGPTCIANVISAMTKLPYSKLTPADTWKWICDKGYMTVGHGTAWAGMTACLKHYGIKDVVISQSKSAVRKALQNNNFCIPLMGPGLWTRGGHFIVAYYVDDKGYIYISDPASGAEARQKNTFEKFWKECKRTWLIIDTADYFKDENYPIGSETFTLYVQDPDGFAYVREGRGTQYKAVGKIVSGKKLKLTYYKDGWYYIASGKYKGYYISEKCLSKTKQINKKYKCLVNVKVRDGYSSKAKVLKTVKRGTTVTAKKRRGYWVYVPSVKGWMKVRDANERFMEAVK